MNVYALNSCRQIWGACGEVPNMIYIYVNLIYINDRPVRFQKSDWSIISIFTYLNLSHLISIYLSPTSVTIIPAPLRFSGFA